MTPEEILRDSEDMATHYPGDRLRLTGAEILELVRHVHNQALQTAMSCFQPELVLTGKQVCDYIRAFRLEGK